MSDIIQNERIKEKYQVFTPPQLANQVLDLIGYTSGLRGKQVLENSCGDGAFLVPIVERYIAESLELGITKTEICEGLQQDISAYEIDPIMVARCIKNLNHIAEQYGIPPVKWSIYCADFLKASVSHQFDYIIGNPPYICYADIPDEDRSFLRETFLTCKKGKFDYCYAFIEKSYQLLCDKGKIAYIIPSNFFKNVFAEDMRQLIKDDLLSIIDFPEETVFEGVLVAPAVIYLQKNKRTPSLEYQIGFSAGAKHRLVSKDTLYGKWCFSCYEPRSMRVGDYYKVSNAVATLRNKVFIINKEYSLDSNYCIVNGDVIETSILKKAVSPKSKRYAKNAQYIIFPYYYNSDGLVGHYSEDEMRLHFPKTMNYLEKNKKDLLERDADENAAWYEFGRSQALQIIPQEKILISSVISDETKPYLLGADDVPYAGLFITRIKESALSTLFNALQSQRFKEYVNNVGVKVSGSSKRITARDLEDFTF